MKCSDTAPLSQKLISEPWLPSIGINLSPHFNMAFSIPRIKLEIPFMPLPNSPSPDPSYSTPYAKRLPSQVMTGEVHAGRAPIGATYHSHRHRHKFHLGISQIRPIDLRSPRHMRRYSSILAIVSPRFHLPDYIHLSSVCETSLSESGT